MRVNIRELQEGCILSEDVHSMTNKPIISQNTVLTAESLEILKAFLVQQVSVEKTLVNDMPFLSAETVEMETAISKKHAGENEMDLLDMFLIGVQNYKKEFIAWQSGLPIDISNIRKIMLPFIEKLEKYPADVFSLHHLSTNEDYIFQHSVAVGILSAFIGKKLKLQKGDLVQLALGGCLSDSGMSKIKAAILNKTSSLTLEEFDEIKMHPVHSFKMVQNISLLRESTKIGIFQHQERLDGSGYPFGEKNQKINSMAKIIAVADSFHAMTSNRLYREKQSPFKVLDTLLHENFGKYDMASILALRSGIMIFSIGSRVKLSDGQIAEILFIEEKAPTKPLVKVLDTGEIIHLETHRLLFIEEVFK